MEWAYAPEGNWESLTCNSHSSRAASLLVTGDGLEMSVGEVNANEGFVLERWVTKGIAIKRHEPLLAAG